MYFLLFWSWNSKIKVPAGLVFPEAPTLGVPVAVFSLCLHVAFPHMCVPIPGASSFPSVLNSSTALPTSFNLNSLPKGSISNDRHIGPLRGYSSIHNKGLVKVTYKQAMNPVVQGDHVT